MYTHIPYTENKSIPELSNFCEKLYKQKRREKKKKGRLATQNGARRTGNIMMSFVAAILTAAP